MQLHLDYERATHFSLALIVLLAVPAFAQSWNSNAGRWNTGYGTVYGSFGYAMGRQNIYNTTQMQSRPRRASAC